MKDILYIGGFELPDKNAAAQRVMANAKLLRDMGFNVTLTGITKEVGSQSNIYEGFCCESLPYPTTTKEWLRYITIFISEDMLSKYHPDYVVLYNFPAIASLKILRYCHDRKILYF